ncbi:thermonuclease family protein [Gilliamella sp. B2840]|uniref:thermonuclease family protein n=1 Tax=Gilliamella sp. B2840 TaxID=2817975 RepID=UPI00226ABE1D|nr:thermonuclease family protein [Gilliamella sp. B2840]MCX8701331.1 thermonuclease family protein [Gilliamella sp. B2840]
MIFLKRFIIFILLSLFLNSFVYADINGKVIKVIDGDTVDILTIKKQKIRVRLLDIDAPESNQAYGNKSKQYLASLIAGKKVFVKSSKKDMYKRTLGTIFLNKVNINTKMVESGYAWAYRYKGMANNILMVNIEEKARQSKKGLWKDEKPIAPWDFRRNNNR